MRKFLLYTFLFWGGVVVVDVLFGMSFDKLNAIANGGGATNKMNTLCMRDTHDILIMGSSRAHHHYIPREIEDSLKMECYNAGFDGMGVILHYGILKLILKRYHPKLIIYDVEPTYDIHTNDNVRYLSLQKPYFRDEQIADIFKKVSPVEYYKVYSGFYRYNSTCFPILMGAFHSEAQEPEKGFIPLLGELQDSAAVKNLPQSETDKTKMYYLSCFIHDAKEAGVPLILIASPHYGSGGMREFEEVNCLCKDNHVPFLNYYSDSFYMSHSRLFNDPSHLNRKGAEIFTRQIVSIIKNRIIK